MNNDKSSGEATLGISRGRQTVGELARQSGADLPTSRGADLQKSRSTPEMMCQQGGDWSRGMACFPQKLVHLVGYRDPDGRPSSPLPRRRTAMVKTPISSDTPIG